MNRKSAMKKMKAPRSAKVPWMDTDLTVEITSSGIRRTIVTGHDLTFKEVCKTIYRFDRGTVAEMVEEERNRLKRAVLYQGWPFDLDFFRPVPEFLEGWDAVYQEWANTGIVVKYMTGSNVGDEVVMGKYWIEPYD